VELVVRQVLKYELVFIKDPALAHYYLIVMDAISEATRREVPWDMLYADDLIMAEDSASNLETVSLGGKGP